jgi:hypothetical protein
MLFGGCGAQFSGWDTACQYQRLPKPADQAVITQGIGRFKDVSRRSCGCRRLV